MNDSDPTNAARGLATADDSTSLPTASLKPDRRISIAWILPMLALILAAWLGYRAWMQRGVGITIQLDDGRGLKAGDSVRYRGISVGQVDGVTLLPDLRGVLVSARLTAQSEKLARNGTRFWVVRPQFQLTRVEGLETLIGPRYLAALPALDAPSSSTQRDFVGLSDSPIIETVEPGDLEIVLQSAQRGSLHAGAPVSFRQTQVGTVLSVGLASDGSFVESRLHIQQPFVALIRPNTRFWDVGGLQAKLGLTGVSIDIDSAESLLAGGVALATPPPAEAGGDIVRTGHRFTIVAKPDKDWLEWQPVVALGSSLLPPGVSPPTPLRASIGWKQGRWIKGERSRRGWMLQTSEGLLGPADLLKPGEKADRDTVVLEVNGAVVPLESAPVWERSGLALLKANVVSVHWPQSRLREPSQPEECLAIADSAANSLPLAASRLSVDLKSTSNGNSWWIDPAVPIDATWHGASVIARSDGALIGMLLVDDGHARVALVPSQSQH